MGELQSKRFDEPDEVVSLPNLTGQIVVLGEVYVGKYRLIDDRATTGESAAYP